MADYQPLYEKSYALIIGIDDYRNVPNLKTARFGAELMAKLLQERYGFDEVLELYDDEATSADVRDAYADLRYMLEPDDRLVVYWTGHGVGIEGNVRSEEWLVPHDASRDADMARLNLTILRFSDEEVITAFTSVLEQIDTHLRYGIARHYMAPLLRRPASP